MSSDISTLQYSTSVKELDFKFGEKIVILSLFKRDIFLWILIQIRKRLCQYSKFSVAGLIWSLILFVSSVSSKVINVPFNSFWSVSQKKTQIRTATFHIGHWKSDFVLQIHHKSICTFYFEYVKQHLCDLLVQLFVYIAHLTYLLRFILVNLYIKCNTII